MQDMEKRSNVLITLQVRWPLVWLGVVAVAAVLIPHRIWTTLLLGVGGLFVAAYIWARAMSQALTAARKLRFGWMAVGDRLQEQFIIRNASQLPALWVEVEDDSHVPGYSAHVVQAVAPTAEVKWRESAICSQRGRFTLGPWRIITGDPFGIFRVVHHYPISEEIVIHPPIHTQLPVPLPTGRRSGRRRARERAWQATVNAAAVRSYHPGDPERWIHWPTSARRNELFVRQFDLDAAGDIWLLLDLEMAVQLGTGVNSTEEHAVLLAASLAAEALGQQRGVGLAAYGSQPQLHIPAQGQGQQWRLLEALALVSADGTLPLKNALGDLRRTAKRGAAVVVLTAATETAEAWLPSLFQLAQKDIQPSVVLFDRPSFGGTGNTAALQTTLRQMGVETHCVRQGEVGQRATAEERQGFWEFKVTALGRAVVVKRPDGVPPQGGR